MFYPTISITRVSYRIRCVRQSDATCILRARLYVKLGRFALEVYMAGLSFASEVIEPFKSGSSSSNSRPDGCQTSIVRVPCRVLCAPRVNGRIDPAPHSWVPLTWDIMSECEFLVHTAPKVCLGTPSEMAQVTDGPTYRRDPPTHTT